MAIRINNTSVIDDNRNLENIANGTFTGTSHVKLPAGTTAQRPSSASAGMIRYNSTDGQFEGFTTEWGAIGGGGGFSDVLTISTNTLAVTQTLYVTTANLTLTLPASPQTGDLVGISNRSGFGNLTIARNGANIMSVANNLTVDVVDAGFTMVYSDATRGWVIL